MPGRSGFVWLAVSSPRNCGSRTTIHNAQVPKISWVWEATAVDTVVALAFRERIMQALGEIAAVRYRSRGIS